MMLRFIHDVTILFCKLTLFERVFVFAYFVLPTQQQLVVTDIIISPGAGKWLLASGWEDFSSALYP